MRIIPVIDLKGGVVVRGVGGRRDEYRPVRSQLVDDPAPAPVAKAFARLGFHEAYVADLDAIAGAAPSFDACRAIAAAGLNLWIDAGVTSVSQAEAILGRAAPRKLIIGLESLPSLAVLDALASRMDNDRLAFSLDLHHGRLLARPDGAGDHAADANEPEDLARAWVDRAVVRGFRSVIVLDLADVGMGRGVSTLPWCRAIRQRHPDLELIAGGGVRSAADLDALAAAGCDAALVASALHDGSLTPQSLAKARG